MINDKIFIANNCTGGFLYRLLDRPYDNPFMWSVMSASDFLKLIKHFYEIDFSNVKLIAPCKTTILSICNDANCKFKHNSIAFMLDNKFEVLFPHHQMDNIGNIHKLTNRFMKFSKEISSIDKDRLFFILDANDIISKNDVLDFLDNVQYNHMAVSKYDIQHRSHVKRLDT